MSVLKQKVSGAARRLGALLGRPGRAEEPGRLAPDRIVWIFGTARTGSTWLSRMMGDVGGQKVWFEPFVGELFGRLYHDWREERHARTKHFVLSTNKGLWLGPMRRFVLETAALRFPAVAASGGYLVVKEPNGSTGAAILAEALPESRLIFLVRDPRDVVASALDTWREGSWHYEHTSEEKRGRERIFGASPDETVRERSETYLTEVGNAKEAYDAHEGPKALVRYEDLLADTLGTMRSLYASLKIPVDENALATAVEKHSWKNVPEEEKGEGKFHRKGKAGGWKEDLTPEQARTVEEITGPLLKTLYP